MSAITKFLPKKALSRLTGIIMHWQGPPWWARFTVSAFASFYKINLNEAEKALEQYPSIGEFFVRKLKPGVRPLGTAWALHPADSRITQAASIQNKQLIQAKSWFYDLKSFTQDPLAYEKWQNGFFITYYLCPTDYHRVHSPVSGEIIRTEFISGELWPVNEWSTSNIESLFTKNERCVLEIGTELGPVALVFVAATNVGNICLSYDKNKKVSVNKGDELGYFRMGSTVVMIYPEKFKEMYGQKLNLGPSVQVGQDLVRTTR
jgi:phosphatidylserine decarboxylase